jgi:hypothetical protein
MQALYIWRAYEPGHAETFFLTIKDRLYCYWNYQTKLIQLWNFILDVYPSRDESFIKQIIPVNRASPYEQPQKLLFMCRMSWNNEISK